ncbi:hypothetical protein HZF24_01435 [Sedimentibacter hydroxybenzoicus DSM 7310]|uniref:Uncharacterized protein n=1 Tax=Sedimentibacter hydroxybenzoicus DSM 7310 TaxID=1123245 RepID=A0A974BGP3_SEDHY|nr:hypothetical protein [Sedimentibacter hydroxybenzoicus]NYB72798.1 hypothetical protein [Sedimentibacter hydroxybenzoicus DSM 7310]
MKMHLKELIIGSLLTILLIGTIITNPPTPNPCNDPPGTGSTIILVHHA